MPQCIERIALGLIECNVHRPPVVGEPRNIHIDPADDVLEDVADEVSFVWFAGNDARHRQLRCQLTFRV